MLLTIPLKYELIFSQISKCSSTEDVEKKFIVELQLLKRTTNQGLLEHQTQIKSYKLFNF